MKVFLPPTDAQRSMSGGTRSTSKSKSRMTMFLMFFIGWLTLLPFATLANDAAVEQIASAEDLAQDQLREKIREKIRAGSTSAIRENAKDFQAENTEALKNALIDRLHSSVEDSDELESDEEDSDELDDDDDAKLIETTARDQALDEGQSKLDESHHVWLHLSSQQKMSFDCFTKPMNTCEAQYCTWVDGSCGLSPGAYGTLCEFYCDTSICIQPAHNVPLGSVVCPVKPKFIRNLCGTMKQPDNCRMQNGMCNWNPQKNRCEATPTCCSRAQTYCSHKRRRRNLLLALHACRGFATHSDLCTFWLQECKGNSP